MGLAGAVVDDAHRLDAPAERVDGALEQHDRDVVLIAVRFVASPGLEHGEVGVELRERRGRCVEQDMRCERLGRVG